MSDDQDLIPPSKSQLKRDMSDLQSLGKQLTTLTPSQLEKFALPSFLQDAIAEFHRIPDKHGAKKRQMQYIGKVMREVPDEIIAAIRMQMEQDTFHEQRKFHAVEQMREKLLGGDSEALTMLVTEFPDLDLQQVRQLIRKARQEGEHNKPPVASRRLFRLLRELHQD